MYIYNTLSKIPIVRKKFSSKFLLISFVGIQLPLVVLIIYLLFDSIRSMPLMRVSLFILTFTAISAAATFYVLDKLMQPLIAAQKSLDCYLTTGEVPDLPTHHQDEVGSLLSHIQTSIEKLDHLLTEKSDLIDLLSHDLRTPLSRIIALSNLIDMDKDCEPQVYTSRIVEESKSLLLLLEDVLMMLKKADGNALTFHLTPTSLKTIVTKAVSFYDYAAKEKNIRYHINIEDGLIVNIEPVMFSQAIKNLLGNALKFTEEGRNIYITSIAEKKKLLLTIKDEGVGFDPRNKEKIFERFTGMSHKGTRGESSTGLGLSLSKKIIEKHGGQLVANSEGIGMGATFTIILPRNNARTHAKGFRNIKVANPFKKAI